MKLVIRETCVASGGAIVERGQIYTTKESDPKVDKEAFDLISANRAYQTGTREATDLLAEVAKEHEAKKAPPKPPGK